MSSPRWLPLLSAVVLVAVGASASSAALIAPEGPLAFTTGDNSELVTTLPVTKSGTPDNRKIVYCIDLGEAPPPGSIIYATAEVEVTSDVPTYPPLVSGVLILADSCTHLTGIEITEANGENCSFNVQHHCTLTKSGVLVVGADSRRYVSLRLHSASGYAAWKATDFVKVEQDYGRLGVLLWKPTTP